MVVCQRRVALAAARRVFTEPGQRLVGQRLVDLRVDLGLLSRRRLTTARSVLVPGAAGDTVAAFRMIHGATACRAEERVILLIVVVIVVGQPARRGQIAARRPPPSLRRCGRASVWRGTQLSVDSAKRCQCSVHGFVRQRRHFVRRHLHDLVQKFCCGVDALIFALLHVGRLVVLVVLVIHGTAAATRHGRHWVGAIAQPIAQLVLHAIHDVRRIVALWNGTHSHRGGSEPGHGVAQQQRRDEHREDEHVVHNDIEVLNWDCCCIDGEQQRARHVHATTVTMPHRCKVRLSPVALHEHCGCSF